MNFTASIDRTSLSLSALAITSDPFALAAEGVDFGPVQYRRQVATSQFVHGGIPTSMVKDLTELGMTVRVKGSTQAVLQTNIDTLIDAVSQWTYTITFSYSSTVYTWTCWAADYAVGATDDRFDLLDVEVSLVIPRSPIPVAGPV